ncbi:DUF6065 family protein [Phyllobacterium sp. CL33Tsu]|uniref:DUF6065 family protein n=1 Tax=Phyllobacterium sp. CL33Tsu TaxID=1798191 RepID=UPI0015873933|nr:DUF6065 family protein [Phyllobacterium sp. CL33Tsu]
MLFLTGFLVDGVVISFRRAWFARGCLDGSVRGFSYRCLPLPVAAAEGWGLLFSWVFLVLLVVFAVLFVVFVTVFVVAGSFPALRGFVTFVFMFHVLWLLLLDACLVLFVICLFSALLGAVVGLSVVVAVVLCGLPFWMRWPLMRLFGVVSFFAGVPFCYVFLFALGRLGVVASLFLPMLGFSVFARGFHLLCFWGLSFTSLFFELPLMVVMVTWALSCFRGVWRSGAFVLGAPRSRFWLLVFFPVLWRSFLFILLLLFSVSFVAVALVYALGWCSLRIVAVLLSVAFGGDVLQARWLGSAVAFWIVVITVVFTLFSMLMGVCLVRLLEWFFVAFVVGSLLVSGSSIFLCCWLALLLFRCGCGLFFVVLMRPVSSCWLRAFIPSSVLSSLLSSRG